MSIATHDISPYVNSVEFERDNDVLDSTCYGSGAHTFVGGLVTGKITVQGLWDKTATVGSQTVFAALVGVSSTTAFIWGPESTTTGNVKYSGTFVLESYAESSPVADLVSYTATLQISGAVTVGVFP